MSRMDAITPLDLKVGDVFTEDGGEPHHVEAAWDDWVTCRGLYSKEVMHRHRTSSWAGWGDLKLTGRIGSDMNRERIEEVARDEYCLDHWGAVKAFADGAEWTMQRWNEELRAAKEAAFHEGYVQGKGAGIDFFTKGVSEGDEPNPYRLEGEEE